MDKNSVRVQGYIAIERLLLKSKTPVSFDIIGA